MLLVLTERGFRDLPEGISDDLVPLFRGVQVDPCGSCATYRRTHPNSPPLPAVSVHPRPRGALFVQPIHASLLGSFAHPASTVVFERQADSAVDEQKQQQGREHPPQQND
ncbi:hypothetical protein [Nonomuraea sediminis]|uniref:hypothetical protein n=1 Tax=Nonomuraea sediminis TaxID=2835864 RepID=UPI001BDCE020|nr:hypothetical protein [Nonomuraea sediminis]